jgi:hypothetical protein
MGLSEQESISAFAEGVSGLQSEWETLPPDQRLDRLEALVNQRLEADGLPHITLTMDHSTYHTGAFDYTDWHMPIAERILTGVSEEEAEAESIFVGNLPEEDLEELIITVYHEARHSEQWFRMAQMLAGRGQSASYIAHHLDIPEDIAAAAVASPLPEGSMEALIAQGWYDTYYGRDAGETSDTYARTRHTHADQEHSEDVFEDSHSHESWETMEGARRRFDRAVDRYEDMPHEADAFRTEEALRTEMLLGE